MCFFLISNRFFLFCEKRVIALGCELPGSRSLAFARRQRGAMKTRVGRQRKEPEMPLAIVYKSFCDVPGFLFPG